MNTLKRIRKILFIILISVVLILTISIMDLYIYSCGSYKAIDCNTYLEETDDVKVEYIDSNIIFTPKSSDKKNTGVIFYPGGLVEKESYAELMYDLCLNGYYAVIIDMPFNLAIFGRAKAKYILDSYSDINWYLCGHSLGGAMASSYYSSNINKYSGLILLAAYSTSDITSGNVLSIKGTNDNILNMDSYNKYINNLPKNTTYKEIDGGNHSYFASYGLQKNDNEALITKEEQIDITCNAVISFIE